MTQEASNPNGPERPGWVQWFMNIAEVVSTRSHDTETKHGAVIVDRDNRILGVGYNGFPRGGQDENMATTRPDKYVFMVHAELNAILNCTLRPQKATMFVTGLPCVECMKAIIQAGIDAVYYGKRQSLMMHEKDRDASLRMASKYRIVTIPTP